MDQVKIGKYLSEKRKKLALTQTQLAEKLNMSDKSVSKWERGICLPDVSLYQELCSILGITVNEFLAGEDISSENLGKKAEDTIIQVAEDSKQRQKRLKRIAGIFIAVAVVALCALLIVLCLPEKDTGPRNYLEQVSDSSVEMYSMLSGQDAYVFKYVIPDEYYYMNLCCTEYADGKVVKQETLFGMGEDYNNVPHEGTIILVFDPEEYTIRVLMTDADGSTSLNWPVLQDVSDRQWLMRSFSEIGITTPSKGEPYRKKAVKIGEECGIGAFVFGRHILHSVCADDLNGLDSIGVEHLRENDYACYFSLITEK